MSKAKVSANLQAWVEVRRKHRLSDAHVQMARELGMNPKKLGGLANHRQEPWKRPLPEFIEGLYARRFGRRRPERVVSLEDRAKEHATKTTLRRAHRAATPASQGRHLRDTNEGGAPMSSPGSHTAVQEVAARQMHVTQEAATIVASAAAYQARVISIGPLLFFSTETGDGWVLDPAEGRARCLARAGSALPTGIVETPSSFSVDWRVTYALEDDVFSVAHHDGRVSAIVGYPIDEIRNVVRLMAAG